MLPTAHGKARRTIFHCNSHPRLCGTIGVWRTRMKGNFSESRRTFSLRRMALLATTAAGLGAAVLIFSPGTYPQGGFPSAAQAENLTEKGQQLAPAPVG